MPSDIEFNEWVVFFRLFALREIDCAARIEARNHLAAHRPAEFAVAQELGPLGRAEERAWARWRRPSSDINANVAATIQ